MDALTLGMFLSPMLTVTTVWITGETGDIHCDTFSDPQIFNSRKTEINEL